MEELSGNSHTARIRQEKTESLNSDEPTPITKKIVEGRVKERPKTVGSRFKAMFIAESTNFSGQLFENIVKPKVQEIGLTVLAAVLDGVKDAATEVITGKPVNRGSSSRVSDFMARRNIPYDRVRSSVAVRPGSPQRFTDRVSTVRRSDKVRDLIVESRRDGESVLDELKDMIDKMSHCTVGDYYDLMGEDVVSTDHEWGWTRADLRDAEVRYLGERGGEDEYLMMMPPPRPIRT